MNTGLGHVLRVVSVGLVVIFAIGIFGYNRTLTTRRQFTLLSDRVSELSVLNADLKNQLYELTDGATLGEVAVLMGLVVEKNPQYLHVGSGATVAQRD